ncbi:MAG: hypothetical protein JJU02_16480 [Cryomorphaceae bacterium]|nr:hypothetical protein [Cryomorphaceae bacterium]
MKKTALILLTLFCVYNLKATEQIKDIIIIESDTFFLRFSPLYDSGLEKQYQDKTCISSALHRGYWAHWKLENDSLFLIKVINGSFFCSNADHLAKHTVFEGRMFASWYSKKMSLPIGESRYCYSCYYPLYEKYWVIDYKNGVVISEIIQPNVDQLEYYENQDKIKKVKEFIVDSLGEYLDVVVDSSAWLNLDCDWTYIFHYNRKGRLKKVSIEDMEETDYEDEKCLAILKKAVKGFQLSHLALPKEPFTIRLDVWHFDGKFDIDRFTFIDR